MKAVERIYPRGRLDVLAFRIAERIAKRHIPTEWPSIEPAAWDLLHRALRPRPRKRRLP